MVLMNNEEFVKNKFREYYKNVKIEVPEIDKREFGIGSWDKKIEMRHLSFNSNDDLNNYLKKDSPFYISFSSAYYEYPEMRPMQKKQWLGADLIFDLDAEKRRNNIANIENLKEVKERTIRLVEDFLLGDFGFKKDELYINFSGSNGYHVHIRNEKIRDLNRKERREIVEYVNGTGLGLDAMIFKRPDGKIIGPVPDDYGYRGKFARFVMNNLERYHPIKAKNQSYADRWKKTIKNGNWTLAAKTGIKKKLEEDLMNLSITLSQDVDVNVTIDLSRLIRVPNTLHGGSSLCAIKIKDLDRFDPMNHAVVLSDKDLETKIEIIKDVPEIIMKDQIFEARKKGEKIKAPEFYALYLICKRAAMLI